ncbi:MAG TPA: porin [Woeseiaceae bacterium]|nr:porin [Woeseiaceae bacterium]
MRSMTRKFLTCFTLGMSFACMPISQALAQGFSYNYLEGTYERIDVDDNFIDGDGDGWGLSGSLEVANNWHVFTSFSKAELDSGFGFDVDFDVTTVGGGYHRALAPNVDLVANLSYVDVEASGAGFSADDDGFGISIGARSLLRGNFELAGYIDYVDLDDGGDDTTIRGEGWYQLNRSFALGAKLGIGDDVTRFGLAGRWYFR